MHDLVVRQTHPKTCSSPETITHISSYRQITTVKTISEEMNTVSLARAAKRAEVQLIRKTSSRVVHTFVKALFPIGKVTFRFDNETQVKHWCIQHPKRLWYLSRSRPGLTEGQTFKSLFLYYLHPCVNTFHCWGELSEQQRSGLGNCGSFKVHGKYNYRYLHPEPSLLKDSEKPLGTLQPNQMGKYDQTHILCYM